VRERATLEELGHGVDVFGRAEDVLELLLGRLTEDALVALGGVEDGEG
jgi:hypothetical protein